MATLSRLLFSRKAPCFSFHAPNYHPSKMAYLFEVKINSQHPLNNTKNPFAPESHISISMKNLLIRTASNQYEQHYLFLLTFLGSLYAHSDQSMKKYVLQNNP